MTEPFPVTDQNKNVWETVRVVASLLAAFILFLFSINLMVASLQNLSQNIAQTILFATSNPFNGLLIGLLITAMLQSSSTSTSLVVAFVASGAISVQGAIPIIMGANIGTTITSTIVSLGFINRKREFRRAVAAGSYHDFFNILTVVVLFPLEYYYGFLSHLSSYVAGYVDVSHTPVESTSTHFSFGFKWVIQLLIDIFPSGILLPLFSIALLFISILIFRRLTSNLLKATNPELFSRFFFKNQLKSFGWGVLTTAAIRSSTITTSVVVPIVAKGFASLKQASPFIMGANIGTTITALIAVTLYANTQDAITIAIAHLFFNLIGVLLWFPIPFLRMIPIRLARWLGSLTLKFRLIGFVYLLSTFFFIPFTLIYINQDIVEHHNLAYERVQQRDTIAYRIRASINHRTQEGQWSRFSGLEPRYRETPAEIFPIYTHNKTLFIGNDMVFFRRPGFCWEGENALGSYHACVERILPRMMIAEKPFDSVYQYRYTFHKAGTNDSATHFYYYSSRLKILLKHNAVVAGDTVVVEKLTAILH